MHKHALIALLSVGLLCNASDSALQVTTDREEPTEKAKIFKFRNWWALGASAVSTAGAAASLCQAYCSLLNAQFHMGEACTSATIINANKVASIRDALNGGLDTTKTNPAVDAITATLLENQVFEHKQSIKNMIESIRDYTNLTIMGSALAATGIIALAYFIYSNYTAYQEAKESHEELHP